VALTWMPWDVAAGAGAFVGTAGVAARGNARPWISRAGAFARELALVLGLYALWRIVGTISVIKVDGAIDAGKGVWDVERAVHLPSELALQNQFLRSDLLIQLCNAFYAAVHIPSMIAFLVWMWVRHRDNYPPVRNVVALTTLFCLIVQLIPVAPPRLVPGLHMQDTPALFGQTVYPSFGKNGPAQLSAMPSVHCAWALIIGVTIVLVSTWRFRWIFLAHPVLTFVVVAVTGNHYWLDGLAVVPLIALAVFFDWKCRASRRKRSVASTGDTDPGGVVRLAGNAGTRPAGGMVGDRSPDPDRTVRTG
jgi:hypothetical protein